MNEQTLTRLLEFDYSQVPLFLVDTLRNPTANTTAFALVLGGITVLILLLILLVVAVFLGMSDEEEEGAAESAEGASQAAAAIAAPAVVEPTPEELRRKKLLAPLVAALWVAVAFAVLLAGGWVSRRDAVCLSCHLDGGLHTTRLEDPERDPHSDVMCVSCHESSNNLVTLTVAVPVRAAHYVGGFIGKRGGQEYGTPVRNAACSGCHESALVGTFENEARGIRISHAEPLESKALCSDCHAPHEGTGVTDGYTVGMETCLRCHDAQTASAKCDYCHTKDVGFAVAARSAVKPTTHVDIVSCGGCHSQKRCDSCHGIRMPHSAAFKNWGHARVAVEDIWYNDGRMCKRCHTDNRRPCARCHGSAFPAHPSKYMPKGHQTADPNSNGCDGCHNYNRWIAGRNFCGICHEKYLGAPIPRR